MDVADELLSAISWESVASHTATSEMLERLFKGELAALSVSSFLTTSECIGLRERIETLEFSEYSNVYPAIGKVGVTVFECDDNGKKAYFDGAVLARQKIVRITNGTCDLVQRVIDCLTSLWPRGSVAIAKEPGYGEYFAGILRRIEHGTLIHVDYAPAEHPDWAVSRVLSQLAVNVYLDVPTVNPGVVRIWRKQWQPEDQIYKVSSSYGYAADVVADTSVAMLVPSAGTMTIINTRNYHQVAPSDGPRLTLSVALGLMPDGKIVLWS